MALRIVGIGIRIKMEVVLNSSYKNSNKSKMYDGPMNSYDGGVEFGEKKQKMTMTGGLV